MMCVRVCESKTMQNQTPIQNNGKLNQPATMKHSFKPSSSSKKNARGKLAADRRSIEQNALRCLDAHSDKRFRILSIHSSLFSTFSKQSRGQQQNQWSIHEKTKTRTIHSKSPNIIDAQEREKRESVCVAFILQTCKGQSTASFNFCFT